MKLTLIGGGGVRAPLFVAAALRRAARLALDELCLLDTEPEKLQIFGGLARALAEQAGGHMRISTTTDARTALTGARYVVTSIRAGGEAGRVLDERIALRHGVLGQETTGPGGFATALRSIPAILGYAELLEQVSPGAWIFNFTNPAGLVTQALRDAGFQRTVGICDSANLAQHAVAGWLGLPAGELRAEVFGLNHLSWTRSVLHQDRDLLAPLLHNPQFCQQTMLRLFDQTLIDQLGMWLNEYLYYYYYAERALAAVGGGERTRGEEIVALTEQLIAQLRAIGVEREPAAALRAYLAYQRQRDAGYMPYAGGAPPVHAALPASEAGPELIEGEGYAGVALALVEALERNVPLYTALNVANQGAIEGMRDQDVVEVSCVVDGAGVRPLPIGAVPAPQEQLMRAVKLYERLTVEAIHTRSRTTAVAALMAHPLVLSYPRACALVADYLAAHRPWVGEWPT